MFGSLIRAAEPYLKAFSLRVISPWKGNHVVYSDLGQAVIPWGFMSQQKISEKVMPSRERRSVIEKRAEQLDLDTREFLQGTEAAYRCIATLFTTRHIKAAPTAEDSSSSVESAAQGVKEGFNQRKNVGADVERQSIVDDVNSRGNKMALEEKQTDRVFPYTNFLDLNVASPQMSMFLNDVLESYWRQNLVPRLTVKNVSARLCSLGIRLGGISKNTNFLGSMSAEEAKYHLTMGLLGPEGGVINELEGRAPQKVIADVCLTCEEEFTLEDDNGQLVHTTPASQGPRIHYLTLQSNIGLKGELEWQVTNINDVIKPTFDYYFARFGH